MNAAVRRTVQLLSTQTSDEVEVKLELTEPLPRSKIDPEQFRACFQRFMGRFADACQGVVAVDGKVLRRSFDKASGKSALHMVSAWGCQQRLVLA